MKKIATILLLTICFLSVRGQTLPDKIVVVKNTYQSQFFSDKENIYRSDTISLTSKRKISKLFKELVKFDKEDQLLNKFDIDTSFILNNPNELLKLYDGYYEKKLDWNEKQKDFIFGKLTDISTYKTGLNQYLSNGCCYTMHSPYRYEYVVLLYNKEELINIYKSSKSIWGYHFPYKDQSNRIVYNFEIDKQLNKFFKRKIKIKKPLKGEDLLKYIVNQIVENNMRELYKLSAYSYENEISELSTDFKIISSEEVYGRGRYIWYEPKTIKITLKNKYMLPNVKIQFLASAVGNSIYSRDSIKTKYQEVLNKVQALDFITEYLTNDTSATLDIYFFNNSAINEYNILKINKTPEEWERHDKYVESLKWYETSDITPSFDIKKSIATSQRNDCGCNLRKEKSFFNKAIFFEIRSSRNPSSIWFLLPDMTVLLYHLETYQVEGASVLDKNLNSLTSDIYLPFTCLLFNDKGELIKK